MLHAYIRNVGYILKDEREYCASLSVLSWQFASNVNFTEMIT